MKSKIVNAFKKTGTALFAAACLFCLLLPLPKNVTQGEAYECVWSDGSVTTESYSSAYQSLAGIDKTHVLLARDGLTGKIESKAEAAYDTLLGGTLGELLQCAAAGTRIGAAALYRAFSERVWYNGEYYVFTGSRVKRVSRATAGELVCLEGAVTSRVLKATNAETLYLRAGATIKTDAFTEGNVTAVYAEAPYAVNGGAVYLDTMSGRRLLTAIASIDELTIETELQFTDEGALLACQNLQSLTLPFLGSRNSAFASEEGRLAHLFSDGKGYRVPQTLSFVAVTGGTVGSFAFYGCSNLEAIDVCGVDPSAISKDAFLGLDSLQVLHTPQQNVQLTGDFNAYRTQDLQCDCTVYIKNDSQK